MFPTQQFTEHGPSSPAEPLVPQAPPRNNPIIVRTSSSSTTPEQLSGVPGRPPSSLPTKWYQPAADLWRTAVAGIADLSLLPDISYDVYDAEYVSSISSGLGGATGKAPISLKQMGFSLKQFATRIGKPNFSAFNKGKQDGWLGVWRRSIGP